jgi:SAM-dependent methyltransferase
LGFNIAFARQLMIEGRRLGFRGRLVALSRYALAFSLPMLEDIAGQVGFPLAYRPSPAEASDEEIQPMASTVFYRMLGFTRATEIEYFEAGEGLYRFDLNRPETPADLAGAADAVFDFGTSEHVFHLPNVLGHVGRMLKPGGIAVHHVPINNHMNHGFYQFSPTLLFDYYRANRFAFEGAYVNIFQRWNSADQYFVPIAPERGWQEYNKTEPNEQSMILFLARKTAESTVGAVPQQRVYEEVAEEDTGSNSI